jgi:hypothetical protein
MRVLEDRHIFFPDVSARMISEYIRKKIVNALVQT